MEYKEVTAHDLNVGDVVEYLGVVDTVLDHKVIPWGESFGGEVQMRLENYGEGIFDSETFILLKTKAPTTTDQYIRILEAIAGEQLTTMARNIHEALQ